ncbi:peptidase M56 [Salirhabdus salicampi]|uniref:peptidase M56 n=1 Tax=Salirhabdus salicampi TaxID=476102 RepID=UPI0020C52CEB|nr:peptidase M56 [Salirhabdus salicampi]MCP8615872.1 peptidase M56 [Salirhabdus salicampi]
MMTTGERIIPYFPIRPQKLYYNPTYRVSLRYPAHWAKIQGYDERYGAHDGYFQVGLIASHNASIDEVVRQEAFHSLNPYGTRPSIIPWRIQGQNARFIFPSFDQPTDMMFQSALIVQLRRPVQTSTGMYDYFILWADKYHLLFISQTTRFF